MPLPGAQEDDASGSRSRARRRRKESTSTPHVLRLGSAPAAAPTSGTRLARRKRSAASTKKKSRRGKKRIRGEREEEDREAKKRDLGSEEEEEEVVVSSAPSSPLCEPYLPGDGVIYSRIYHPEIYKAFDAEKSSYRQKLAAQFDLPTLEFFTASTCLSADPKLLPGRESGREAVLRSAHYVLGLSSFVNNTLLRRCSGFWIERDEKKNTGIVLTTAHLIRSNCPSMDHWLGHDEYSAEAKVVIHLLDDTTAEGQLIYLQKHYDLAFFRVGVDQSLQLPVPDFSNSVECAQEVFQLGRDEKMNLRITHGRAEYLNPTIYDRYHYMYLSRKDVDNEFDDGGPVIDFDSNVVGIVNNSTDGSFIPSSILLKCLDLWRTHGSIPRPHLGLKFFAIKLLDPAHIEKIRRKFNIDRGLIVQEVSKESHAEKLGIRMGDVIECFEGENISTTVELENMLLDLSKGHFAKGNDSHANINVSIGVFNARKRLWRTRELTVNVSDQGEIVAKATRPFNIEGISASVPPDLVASG